MATKLNRYRQACELPEVNHLWPLYGTGFESLGCNQQPVTAPIPGYGADELLVRHDTCGICFTDIKIIKAGPKHFRIARDLQQEPIVLGHEVMMTVVGVGDHLGHNYRVGDRLVVQPAVSYRGDLLGYGLMIQGGMSRYGTVDRRVLCGDEGNYLLPVRAEIGYAEAALLEPWSCATAAYRLKYRTGLKDGGTTWIIGTSQAREDYFFSTGLDETGHPARLCLTQVPPPFADWLEARAVRLDIEIINMPLDAPDDPTFDLPGFDNIIVMALAPTAIEEAASYLAPGGVMNVFAGLPRGTLVPLDLSGVYLQKQRYIGHMGATVGDMRQTLAQVEAGRLSPNRLVKAVGSLEAAYDGFQAVREASFPGKVVIFPQIKPFPLVALPDLKEKLPKVYAKLRDGREWTIEAEEEFLETLLP